MQILGPDEGSLPALPKTPLLEHWLFESPTLLTGLLVVLGVVALIAALRRKKKLAPLIGAVVLFVLAAGVYVTAGLVTTDREVLMGRTAELVGAVDTTLIGASYDVALGHVAGDTPEQMTGFLRSKLRLVRVKDRGDDQPVQVGDGEIPVEPFVRQLERSRWSGPVVFEWEAAWYEGLVPIEEVLPIAVRRLCDWAGLTKGAMAVA